MTDEAARLVFSNNDRLTGNEVGTVQGLDTSRPFERLLYGTDVVGEESVFDR